jgi:hypothetical protein
LEWLTRTTPAVLAGTQCGVEIDRLLRPKADDAGDPLAVQDALLADGHGVPSEFGPLADGVAG